jgi:hypothetical protein
VHDNVKNAEQKLQQIQEMIQTSGHTDSLLEEEKQAHKVYEEALTRQKCFWQEKAKLS